MDHAASTPVSYLEERQGGVSSENKSLPQPCLFYTKSLLLCAPVRVFIHMQRTVRVRLTGVRVMSSTVYHILFEGLS